MCDIRAISSSSRISDEGVKSPREALVENDSLKKTLSTGRVSQGKQRIG